jgi:hypothetical protein
MEFGYAQLGLLLHAERIAQAEARRIKLEARQGRDGANYPRNPYRARNLLVTAATAIVVVFLLSSVALARPVKDDPFFERSGTTPAGTETSEPSLSAEPTSMPWLIGAGLVVLASGVAVMVAHHRPKAA